MSSGRSEEFEKKLEALKRKLLATMAPAARVAQDPALLKQVENEADDFDLKAKKQLHREKLVAEKLRNKSLRDDIAARRETASQLFGVMVVWLTAIYFLVLFDGSRYCEIDISENVLLAMIGSTTLNVLGLYYIVANYLFPKPK